MDAEVLIDYQEREIRLTSERWQHILDHPEMVGQRERLDEVLVEPDIIIATEKDPSVHVYHRWYDSTPVTKKYAVIAVKMLEDDAFVLTAYFTSRVRKGTTVWQK
ncbi:MAG: hypothetical protein JXQ72_07010 [Anaerolineae bacterium]|nr:hypothetical protein [Anaerolineae bacterium]